ncbi:MAG: putative carboxypeptidase [Monoraphidium minutum]|nr:MAG: putative carboxypeptidase [Monoraphidium minutum]
MNRMRCSLAIVALALALAAAAPRAAEGLGEQCAAPGGASSGSGTCDAAGGGGGGGALAPDQAYGKLVSKLRELNALEGISGLLGWDEMVMMPAGAAESRGAQKSALAGVIYDKKTEPEMGSLLEGLKAEAAKLGPVPAAVVRDASKEYRKATALPKELVQRIAKLETDAYAAWVEARKASDFSKFAPFLQQWVDVRREAAALIDPARDPYDVLLDDYEKGMTAARLDGIFDEVRGGLVPLIADLKSKGTPPDDKWLTGDYDTKAQAALCQEIALDMGFDLEHGRLDVSVHPFTGGAHPTDVRMTTRFKAHDLTEGLTGAVHETGHALYEQGRNLSPEWRDLPVNTALSMGIHESQSLLWERMVALGQPFCHYMAGKVHKHFPSFPERPPADLYAAINTIKDPSLIRVESDEVTYGMHIVLRYEMERALIGGTLKVEDVPRVWNEKMAQYLGVTPKDDAQGCLQDVHWSAGLFGYFPTYLLGAMYACQIYQHASTQIPGLEAKIQAGDFKPLREWLNANIHTRGSLDPSGDDLMAAVTGSPLKPSVFLAHLRAKYAGLYKL